MKVSRYNIFYRMDNEWIAYNSFTNSLAVLEEENYREYRKFEKNNNYLLDEEFLKKLQQGGYIVEDDCDELQLLEYEKQVERFNQSTLSLTIAPTLNCNFRCAYCYEKERYENKVMGEDVQNSIIDLVESKKEDLKQLAIAWYGGEPLLAIEVVESLSENLKALCTTNNIGYSAVIVTNGYLLTDVYAQKLQKAGITSVQITLDGLEERHNKKRPLKNGEGTYRRIIENIKSNAHYFDEILIRVNCDSENITEYTNLYNEIKALKLNNIKMYASPIRDFDGCYSCGGCIDKAEFKELESGIYKSLGGEIYTRFILDKYPVRGANYCGAQINNSLIVAADGKMYKCWGDVGNTNRTFGNVCDINKVDVNKCIYYFNAYKGEDCKQCAYYPICSGGCPHENRIGKADVCEYNEKILNDYLEEIVKYKKKKA